MGVVVEGTGSGHPSFNLQSNVTLSESGVTFLDTRGWS